MPRALGPAWGALSALALAGTVAAGPAATPAPSARPAPRAHLIYLIDGGDPIVVRSYVQDGDQIRFEKYGGWVGIPRYEVLRIVPDEPELPVAPEPPAAGGPSQAALYVAVREGPGLRATAVRTREAEVRVTTPEGSLRFARSDLVGVLRVPPRPAAPEAWITLVSREERAGEIERAPDAPVPGGEPLTVFSDRPHLLQLADGTQIQVDGFWIEDGQIRFRRLGGIVGFALTEIARLVPQEVEPARGRTAARFVRRVGPDRLEVRLPGSTQRIRLIGIEPIEGGAAPLEDPWAALQPGAPVELEFDRQRYEPGGEWLAYVYLPGGRMLNTELLRAGRARPRPERRNVRYLDLFQEVWATRDSGAGG